jgi:two-component system, LytTR family, response regulator
MSSSSSPTRWSALVVDDEPLAREGVRMLLAAENEIQRVLEAKNGPEAVALIRSEKPDIVFLDVQMPEMNGFEVLQEIGPESMPVVIFVTAHDQYAIKAFEINAIDYLLKPVTRQRFKEALRRATDRLRSPNADERMLSMLQTIASPRKYMTRIAVRSGGKTYFVELAEVDWMQAAENYVQLHTASAKHLVHVPIQTLQDSIDPDRFLRIHRSLIVNLQQVKEIEPASHGECVLVLHSGVRLQSSRTYSDAIRRWANNPF